MPRFTGRSLPRVVRTERLVLRSQQPEDAAMIKEAIDASLAHLRASVAWAQAAPTLESLESRLAASAAAFDACEEWTFSVLDAGQTQVLGGVSLELAEAALTAIVGPESLETGYWLRTDATGHGYATEAVAALVKLA